MAATVFFLADGIKKLRSVEADREKKRADKRDEALGVDAKAASTAGGPTGKFTSGAGKIVQAPTLERGKSSARINKIMQEHENVVDLWRGMRNLKTAEGSYSARAASLLS